MLFSSAIRPPPFREPNSSRNITGKASEKKAENGLRRNSLFWARNCRHSRDGADGRPGGVRGTTGVVPRSIGGVRGTAGVVPRWVGGRSGMGQLLGAGGPQATVLEGGAGHGQGVQLLSTVQGPAGEEVQGPGRLGGGQLDPAGGGRGRGGQAGRPAGEGRAPRG